MIQLILIVIVIGLFYYYCIKPMSYWRERGVIQGHPVWLLGDSWRTLFRMESFTNMFQRAYDLSPDARYTGFYQFTTPTLMVKDPELLKQITVKDFEHFMNHSQFVPEEADQLWSKNLVSLKDQRWKEIRPILSPSFTSSKMKMMYTLMADCAENFVKHFLKKDEDVIEVTIKDIGTRFANDIIASTAFGIHTDSMEEPNNQFYLMGRDITDFSSVRKGLKFFGYFVMPKILQFFNIQFFDGESRQFFIDLIDNTLKMRERENFVRHDMIHLLMEAKKGIYHKEEHGLVDTGFATVKEADLEKPTIAHEISNMEITAQALIFFFAGFDSVSSLMCFMSYELATHPDIQDRLREEINEGFVDCKGKLTYETLVKMKYLDMVISESLRKWPNFSSTDRACSKRYVIEPTNPNEQPIVLERGALMNIPIMSIQNDPKYFPNPERFDPERFNDDNKDNIDPYTYHPFGLGPRNCIGSRFAILETKALFANLLHNFEIVPTANTKIPLELSKVTFNLHPADGMKLGLKRLKK